MSIYKPYEISAFLPQTCSPIDTVIGEPDIEMYPLEDIASNATRLMIYKQSHGHSLNCRNAIWHIDDSPLLGWSLKDTVETFREKLIKNGITTIHNHYCFIKQDGVQNDQNELAYIIHSVMYKQHRIYYVVLEY